MLSKNKNKKMKRNGKPGADINVIYIEMWILTMLIIDFDEVMNAYTYFSVEMKIELLETGIKMNTTNKNSSSL